MTTRNMVDMCYCMIVVIIVSIAVTCWGDANKLMAREEAARQYNAAHPPHHIAPTYGPPRFLGHVPGPTSTPGGTMKMVRTLYMPDAVDVHDEVSITVRGASDRPISISIGAPSR